MKASNYTVADALLDTLKAHDVTHIFGYPGGAIMPFYDALPRHYPDITHILTRHEQGAAFMAQGWARSTKKLGVCCATSGPGATNLVTGIADAYMDSIPMLAITGQVFLPMIGKDAFQEVDITGITLPITKHNFLIDTVEDIVPITCEAIEIAMSGRPGPVLIDIPKDIMMSEHTKTFEIPTVEFDGIDPMLKAYDEVDDATIERVIHELKVAKKPVLLLGQGVKHSKAEEMVQRLIQILGIPTVTTVLAKGVMRDNDKHYLGMLGMHGFYHCNMAMHEADLIVNIGSRFDDRIVGRYDEFAKNAKVIHCDIDESELNKAVKADVAIHSDAKKFVDKLIASSKLQELSIEDWRTKITSWKKNKPYEKNTESFSMRNCLDALSNLIKKDPEQYIVSVDVGQHQMWTALSCMVGDSCKWLCSGGSGTMGFGLPAAIGAAFACPDKTVISISGDGGVQMNIQELGVIKDHNLDVKVLILNNEYLGMVRQWQELVYERNYSEVAITSPDYPVLSKAYGITGYKVTNNNQIDDIHSKVFSERGPALIEYKVENEDNVFPMVPQGKHLGQTIISSSEMQ